MAIMASMALTAQAAIVQTNATYATVELLDAQVSAVDLANVGQSTFDSSTVTASQGANVPEAGFNDGMVSADFTNFDNVTWFHDRKDHLPATITLNLDVTVNTLGYDILEIVSFAGWVKADQADQIMTVEFSLVNDAGFTTLGTGAFSYTTPGSGEFSSIRLSEDAVTYLATGVDVLRFTYAASGNNLLLQEIDVKGVAYAVDSDLGAGDRGVLVTIPELSTGALIGGLLALSFVMLRRRRS
jgi:hypothetical protein